MITALYRISDGSYNKRRLEYATKYNCLSNFINVFKNNNILVFTDGVKEDSTKRIIELARQNYKVVDDIKAGSSAASFRYVMNYAIDNLKDDDIVYFCEDDYLHSENALTILLEGIQIAHYVTGYDHADKYLPASKGGNSEIGDDGGEYTKVYLTKNSHWKLCNSTTMTVMTKVKTLKDDKDTWLKYTEGSYPHDFQIFIELRNKGKSLISSIPGVSTHSEIPWQSPLIDWSKVI